MTLDVVCGCHEQSTQPQFDRDRIAIGRLRRFFGAGWQRLTGFKKQSQSLASSVERWENEGGLVAAQDGHATNDAHTTADAHTLGDSIEQREQETE